jgi:hypothetical protein
MELTREEKEAILSIGSESDEAGVLQHVWDMLVEKGIVHRRPSDGRFDLSEVGESVFDELAGTQD